jgi:4-hydroxybenzoate polyprenyltransferase/phosphoserine phosphatase
MEHQAAPSTADADADAPAATLPLCVDLDGTLIRTDALWESLMLLAKRRPGDLLRLPLWVARGKAYAKDQIAARVVPDAASLPYCEPLLEFLRAEKAAGRKLVLATASDRRIARAVADHVGLFDEVVASDGADNLGGRRKLARLETLYGKGNFDYVGNANADLPLWAACKQAYVVNASAGCLGRAKKLCTPAAVIDRPAGAALGVLRALRPLQWAKNALVAAPIVLAHKTGDAARLLDTALAVVAFCLCASAVYVLNDLLDLEADRHHPRKRRRPFASGAVPIPVGVAMFFALLAGAAATAALTFNPLFVAMLAAYFCLTTAYTFYFKAKLLLDVILLAGLYTHRIVAGAVAANVDLTPWLLAFSMFLFLSLAFAKRYSELVIAEAQERTDLKGRSYTVDDLRIIESVGPTSGYLAVLVLCLYLQSDIVVKLYRHPKVLWLAGPLLLYWITRLWFFARRRKLVDDPLVFAMTDRVSLIAGAVMALIVIAAAI